MKFPWELLEARPNISDGSGMDSRIRQFLEEAKEARARAAASDTRYPQEWLKIAQAWEQLAAEAGLPVPGGGADPADTGTRDS